MPELDAIGSAFFGFRATFCLNDNNLIFLIMDKNRAKPYLFIMFRFLLIIFSVLAFGAMSVMTQAHESSMVMMSGDSHAVQMARMEPVSSTMNYCVEDNICMKDSAVCELICFGTGGFLFHMQAELAAFSAQNPYDLALESALVASRLQVAERPPILHFL